MATYYKKSGYNIPQPGSSWNYGTSGIPGNSGSAGTSGNPGKSLGLKSIKIPNQPKLNIEKSRIIQSQPIMVGGAKKSGSKKFNLTEAIMNNPASIIVKLASATGSYIFNSIFSLVNTQKKLIQENSKKSNSSNVSSNMETLGSAVKIKSTEDVSI